MNTPQKIYFGVGLNDSLPSKRTAGKISIENNHIVFRYEDDEVRLPFSGIKSYRGGSGNSLVFFNHPSYPEWSIYTSDKTILKDKALSSDPNFSSLSSSYNRQTLIFGILIFLSAFILTSLIYGFYYFKESFTYFIASKIPISIERKLGKAVFESMSKGKTFYKDESVMKLLNPVTDPLLEASKSSGYEFEFYIMEDKTMNAFALPGGVVVIHSELIRKAETPEEIAGVLAHEISHVTQKHGLRQIINSIGVFVIVQTLFGDITGVLAIFTQNSGILLSSAFSRDYEREADAKGFHYLVHSKVDPIGMVNFFEKIKTTENEVLDEETKDVLSFLSTHPGTEERIENIRKKRDELKEKEFVPIRMDLKKLQSMLNK
ncbi:MAG: M48 family metallopeptidase [Leptospiraceae bacterium]|nr:M48 family metallopeptidase [Leptospiraceae bacterium]MCP5513549.1 M48 family metallopeptidase [Leptospiraceae bacterium]